MGTASTRSHSRNARAQTQTSDTPEGVEISSRSWILAATVIVVVAAFLRLYDLDLVPLHHDEGVNGNFLVRLVREGFYRYDPANYHGPTLYYFAALFPRLLRLLFGINAQNSYGLTTTAIRAVPALFGVATVALIFTLRRYLGMIGTLSAAGLLAISPGAVYLSRYFIHETLFVFFTLAIVVTILKYYENGHPAYLILAAISTGLLFATKETAIISVIVLVIALVMTRLYRSFWKKHLDRDAVSRKKKRRGPSGGELEVSFVERTGGPSRLAIWVLVAIGVFIAVNVLLYSSFFTNYPKGIGDALRTFEFWRKTGKEAHVHPFVTYVWWLLLQESPLLTLGAIGAIVAVLKPTRSFALFSALWAFGLIAAYSLIDYKTPWLTLNFIVPLALASGSAMQWINDELRQWNLGGRAQIYISVIILVVATGILPGGVRAFTQKELHWKTFTPAYQAVDLNFLNYDNDDQYYVYVYAHTRREMLKLVDEINRIAQRTHQGSQTGITIVSPDYWPLPWYLRDYNRVGYFGRMTPSNEPIIIASQGQVEEVKATFGDRYQQVQSGSNIAGSYPLRPGVDLLLFTRRELVR